MAFDPEEFLNLANEIYKDSAYQEESCYRTIIGRAYYAAFLFTREKLSGHVTFNFNSKDHQIVIKEIRNRISPAISGQLRSCREQRNRADYELTPIPPITKFLANYYKGVAEHIIEEVNKNIK